MIPVLSQLHRRSVKLLAAPITIILVALGLSACTRFQTTEIRLDGAADHMIARLKRSNIDLQRFKCVGKMILATGDQPSRSFRAALAGQLDDRLRIDMFAPFGGAAGTFASDGRNLFLVMHPTREYYKKRFSGGSLRRLIHINITVDDLLALLVGRIPMEDEYLARLVPTEEGHAEFLEFVDWSRQVRQRITVDASMHPRRSEWFDRHQRMTHNLTFVGGQMIDGFWLPERIELSGPNGAQVTVVLERYEANTELDERLFSPDNPWS